MYAVVSLGEDGLEADGFQLVDAFESARSFTKKILEEKADTVSVARDRIVSSSSENEFWLLR